MSFLLHLVVSLLLNATTGERWPAGGLSCLHLLSSCESWVKSVTAELHVCCGETTHAHTHSHCKLREPEAGWLPSVSNNSNEWYLLKCNYAITFPFSSLVSVGSVCISKETYCEPYFKIFVPSQWTVVSFSAQKSYFIFLVSTVSLTAANIKCHTVFY